MSDAKPAKIKGIVLRDFNDAGTEERFTAGDKPVEFDAGTFANYEAAGLVRAPGEKAAPAA